MLMGLGALATIVLDDPVDVFAAANVAALVLPNFGPLMASRVVAACGAAVFTPTAAAVDYSVPRLKTPISCQVDTSAWQPLEGVDELPTAFQSAIGKAAWFASGSDPARAAAWASARAGGPGRRPGAP